MGQNTESQSGTYSSRRRNIPAILLGFWWLFFGLVSLYWSFGGLWLVDTALQGEGLQLAHDQPAWFMAVVFASAIIKLGFALYGALLIVPWGRKIPAWLYLVFGYAVGTGCALYGIARSIPGIPYLLGGGMTPYRSGTLFLWMPQFWVGGLLMLAATAIFASQTRQAKHTLKATQ